VLLLWDRVLAFDSLWLVPLLAAAIFAFRAPTILQCRGEADLDVVFADPSQLSVIALLQQFLFLEGTVEQL